MTERKQQRHHCQAWVCEVEVTPATFMCRDHWLMVPPTLRFEINQSYAPGQKRPSVRWRRAAWSAVRYVAEAENRENGVWVSTRILERMEANSGR